jgi:HD superfamily phosphodiesterase
MESIDVKVQNFKQWLKDVMEVQKRDSSHGMEHFERVRVGALDIAVKTSPPNEEESLLLQLAALCHDVLDHKYMTKIEDGRGEGSVAPKEELKTAMKEALRSLAGLSPRQVDDVCLVSDNVSLSKELEGLLEEDLLMERRLSHLRDYVSDADKLDALGMGGIRRLAQYQARLLQDSGASMHRLSSEFLRGIAQRHLLHRVNYLRTKAAAVEGGRLLRETTCIMASDAALERIIEWVLLEEMKSNASTSRTGTVAV